MSMSIHSQAPKIRADIQASKGYMTIDQAAQYFLMSTFPPLLNGVIVSILKYIRVSCSRSKQKT